VGDSRATEALALQDAHMSANFQQLANFIWSVADLLRGPYLNRPGFSGGSSI